MIGIVIVSHSAKLAEGVAELAREMAGPDVRLAVAGGLDLPDRPLGTDAALVLKAIEQVYSDEGVLVLVDLGSALLSTELAIEMLPAEQRQHVVLSDAPLVEGAVAAAVQARLGSPLDQVINEARIALSAKSTHMQTPVSVLEPGPEAQHILSLIVSNELGLHARPAARIVETASGFAADIQLRNVTAGRGPVNAKSIISLMTLAIQQGHQIEFSAVGADAEAALAALRRLAEAKFGDE
jgi:multiphosphoryl transfer protein